MGQPVNVTGLPIVSPDFHAGADGDRIVAGAVATIRDSKTGVIEERQIWVNSLEILTPDDLLQEARAAFELSREVGAPEDYEGLVVVGLYLIFLATRY
jgi:hypothetical protein